MLTARVMILASLALAGCATRSAVMQAGDSTSRPLPVAAPTPPRTAWYDTIRPLATLGKGWNRIPGRFGTGCAHDSTFAFKVRPGLPDKVMIFLNGGGACWRAQDCDPRSKPTYTMTIDSANDVATRTGIFDVANEKNPLRDYTMVFVPYCTGDVHLGTRETEYENGKRAFAVRHGGAANLEAVLDWVYTNVRNPGTVFVTGVSAGAVASPVVAGKIARHYPRARIVQLGDGAGGYHADSVPSVLSGWGATDYLREDPAFRSIDASEFTFERLYLAAARTAPRVRFAQVNAANDATQAFFLGLLGVKAAPVPRLLATDLAELRDGVPWFHSYTLPGKVHTILRSNAMYTARVDNVLFRDWLQALVDDDTVEDVGESLLSAKPRVEKR